MNDPHADEVLGTAIRNVWYDMANGKDCSVQANLAASILWDARKYLGCYPSDAGKVAMPGLYTDKHFQV